MLYQETCLQGLSQRLDFLMTKCEEVLFLHHFLPNLGYKIQILLQSDKAPKNQSDFKTEKISY